MGRGGYHGGRGSKNPVSLKAVSIIETFSPNERGSFISAVKSLKGRSYARFNDIQLADLRSFENMQRKGLINIKSSGVTAATQNLGYRDKRYTVSITSTRMTEPARRAALKVLNRRG